MLDTPAPQKTRRIGVLLFPQFSMHCLANAIEPLRGANTLAGQVLYEWEFLSLDGKPLQSSSGLPVTPAMPLSDHPGGDLLMIIPSYGHPDHATPATSRGLRAASKRFAHLGGFDTGSWLLAKAGLLEGYRATIHWDVLTDLAETFPEIEVSEDRFVIDRNRISCGGASTTMELMLHLIGLHHGAMLRLEVSALFMHGERDLSATPHQRHSDDQWVEMAVSLMRRNLETPLSIPEVAAHLGISARALEAHFAKATARTPQSTYRSLRLAAARRLVQQTTYSIAEIGTRCGYEDPSALTRAFRKEFGTTPRALRLS